MARRSAGCPLLTAYWFSPALMAAIAAAFTASGPSKSGNPWPRLIAWRSTARRDITANMLLPKLETRSAEFMIMEVRSQKPDVRVSDFRPLALLPGHLILESGSNKHAI